MKPTRNRIIVKLLPMPDINLLAVIASNLLESTHAEVVTIGRLDKPKDFSELQVGMKVLIPKYMGTVLNEKEGIKMFNVNDLLGILSND